MKGDEKRYGTAVDRGQEYTAEELEFMKAVDRWKRKNNCPYPSWGQVLAIARALGWRKVAGGEGE
jgi:hypothetical protein